MSVARAFFWGPSSIYVQVSSTKDRRIQSGLFSDGPFLHNFQYQKRSTSWYSRLCLSESRSLSKQDEKRRGEDTRAMTSKARTRMCACALVLSLTSSVCSKEAQASPYIFISSCASVRSREAQASHERRRALSSSPSRHDILPHDLPPS